MKKSSRLGLALIAGLLLVGCNQRGHDVSHTTIDSLQTVSTVTDGSTTRDSHNLAIFIGAVKAQLNDCSESENGIADSVIYIDTVRAVSVDDTRYRLLSLVNTECTMPGQNQLLYLVAGDGAESLFVYDKDPSSNSNGEELTVDTLFAVKGKSGSSVLLFDVRNRFLKRLEDEESNVVELTKVTRWIVRPSKNSFEVLHQIPLLEYRDSIGVGFTHELLANPTDGVLSITKKSDTVSPEQEKLIGNLPYER